MSDIRIPELVRASVEAHDATEWLQSLPSLVEDLGRRWSLSVGDPHEGGTESIVFDVTVAGGNDAVLKIGLPMRHRELAAEAEVLRLVDGEGCAELYESDVERGALLMERLGAPLSSLDYSLEQRDEILCRTAAQVWRPLPDQVDLDSAAVKGSSLVALASELWEELGHPCSEHAVTFAVACGERRIAAHDDERAVLVHGDLHQWNVLQAGDSWKLIDPEALHAEPEYDLGIVMRESPEVFHEISSLDRARSLAATTGLDAVAIHEWGAIERLVNGLLWLREGQEELGRPFLEAAELVATS